MHVGVWERDYVWSSGESQKGFSPQEKIKLKKFTSISTEPNEARIGDFL